MYFHKGKDFKIILLQMDYFRKLQNSKILLFVIAHEKRNDYLIKK